MGKLAIKNLSEGKEIGTKSKQSSIVPKITKQFMANNDEKMMKQKKKQDDEMLCMMSTMGKEKGEKIWYKDFSSSIIKKYQDECVSTRITHLNAILRIE